MHDLRVTSTQVAVFAGFPYNLTATLPTGAKLSAISWWFGDGGSRLAQTTLTTSYAYPSAGLDFVFASAVDSGGTVHDNLNDALPVEVLVSHASDAFGTAPDLLGAVTANGSGGANPTALIAPGGSVTVSVVTLVPPRNVQTNVLGVGFAGPAPATSHATRSGETDVANGTSSVTLAFDSGQPVGLETLTYWEETSLRFNGSTIDSWNNFTFTIGVGLGGGGVPRAASPNPNQLTVDRPAAPYSFDPAIDYDTAGMEAFANVYQTLLTPNGTQTGSAPNDFVPEIATCVPGSTLCTSLYASSLVNNGDYTFVISHAPRFYDPSTSTSWGVYPSDVVFSIARTLAFSTLPCQGCNNGWILAQALLSSGNAGWDAIHVPYNNTPDRIFASMAVNGTDCPASALTNDHGCVTFHATANGQLWPYFLSLLADPAGGSIVSCGWTSAATQGAGIPYWSAGNVSGAGDAPCPMPGVGGFGVAPGSMPPMGWDAYETTGANAPFLGNLQYAAVGSGPYYTSSLTPGGSYALAANPSYAANPDCTFAGCQPSAGTFAATVDVFVVPSMSTTTLGLAGGSVDLTSLASNATSMLPTLIGLGAAGLRSSPVLSIDFHAMNLHFNATAATAITGTTYTAPGDLLADVNARQFLAHAFSYANAQTQLFTAGGIQYRFPQGGSIPTSLDGSTPTNVSWPTGDPDRNPNDVGSAAYWWNQTRSDGTSLASCLAISPCTFPVPYVTGDDVEKALLTTWASTVVSISGGALVPEITNVSFITLVVATLYSGMFNDPFPLYPLGWVADFADMTDFVNPTYQPDQYYAFADALGETLGLSQYNASTCSTSLSHYSTLAGPIPVDCQGAAYDAMRNALTRAASTANGPGRDLLYNMAEQVAQRLALYASNGQANDVQAIAPWIDPQSLVVNPTLQVVPFYELRDRPGPGSPLAIRGPAVDVNPAPASSVIHLSGLATGGSAGYAYVWSNLPTGCSTSNAPTLACMPSTPGTYNLTLRVTDQLGAIVSGWLVVVIGTPLPLAFSGFSATPSSVVAGHPTTLAVATTGGVAPLHYAYTGLPPGCSSVDAASFSCTPGTAGSYTPDVFVNDSNGSSVSGSTPLTVTPGAVFAASLGVMPSSAAVDVGVPVTIVLAGSGGTLPIAGTLSAPGGCARTFTWTTVRAVNVTCTAPTASGTDPLTVTLNDSLGATTNATGMLTVHPTPSITSLGPGHTFDVNQSSALVLAFSGGTGPFTVAYAKLPPGCPGGNVTTMTCKFGQAGTYSVGVTLTDAFGLFTTSVVKIVVAPELVVTSVVATPTSVSLGSVVNLTVATHGGSLPLNFTYAALPSACASVNRSFLSCQPTVAGTYLVGVTVRDMAGISVLANVTFTATGSLLVPPPTDRTASNTLLVEELLSVAALVVVVAAIGYVVSRRRRGGGTDEEPSPPEPEAVEAPPPDGPTGPPPE